MSQPKNTKRLTEQTRRINKSREKGTLTVCGWGIDNWLHITPQTLRALRECDVVFGFEGTMGAVIRQKMPSCDFRDLSAYYGGPSVNITVRPEKKIAAAVIESLKKGRKTGFVAPGHPLLFDSSVTELVAQCRRAGFKLSVLPGISFIDGVLAALAYPVSTGGLQVFQSNFITKAGVLINTQLPLIICRLGIVRREKAEAVFERSLKAVYPKAHVIAIVKCAQFAGSARQVTEIPLGKISGHWNSIDTETTLFIPPLMRLGHGMQRF